jgi:hypothetical protein
MEGIHADRTALDAVLRVTGLVALVPIRRTIERRFDLGGGARSQVQGALSDLVN